LRRWREEVKAVRVVLGEMGLVVVAVAVVVVVGVELGVGAEVVAMSRDVVMEVVVGGKGVDELACLVEAEDAETKVSLEDEPIERVERLERR
jgi:hypothetical protein